MQEVEVAVDAQVDVTTARALNKGTEVLVLSFISRYFLLLIDTQVLDDIVVLRIENGCDFYLEVKAGYARSCYGIVI